MKNTPKNNRSRALLLSYKTNSFLLRVDRSFFVTGPKFFVRLSHSSIVIIGPFIIFISTEKVTGCYTNLPLTIFSFYTTCLTGLLLDIKNLDR